MDAHVDSRYEMDNFYDSYILKTMGGDNIQRSFVKFQLPEIRTGDMVVGARLVLAAFPKDNGERSIAVHKVLHDWDSATLNWNNRPLYEETVQDICRFHVEGNKGSYITFDITRLVKDWYQNGANYGLMFKNERELLWEHVEFQSSDEDDAYEGQRPRIEISYMNYSGLEDFWSYHTQDVGRAGSVHVNDYNGNLILIHDTLQMGGSRIPAALSHVYNTNDMKEDTGYGYGVRLSYHQTVESVMIAGTQYYRHVDGNGTVHYFYKDTEDNTWKDEAVTDRILTVNGDGTFVISDKKDNRLVFGNNGYLTAVKDAEGQALSISYNADHCISKITDPAQRAITLTYGSCSDGEVRLQKVTAPDGTETAFTYSSSGMLTGITYPDGVQTAYKYKDRRLIRVTGPDGYNVRYEYHTASLPYRVKKITEYAGETKGKSLSMVYGHNSTRYTDGKGRKEIYRFNHMGNLLHIHDSFGHAASAGYNRSGNHVNCLENATKLQDNIVQLLKNPAMLAGTTGWSSSVSAASEGENTLNTDPVYCMAGTRSLRSRCTDLTGYANWGQVVQIKKGVTYTASAYVYAEIEEAGAGGAMLRVRYKDRDGDYQFFDSEVLKSSTDGFVRLSVTFELPEDASVSTVRVMVAIREAKGTVYADMAQLEVGDTPGRCNLLVNAELHQGSADDYTNGNDAEDVLTEVGNYQRVPFERNFVTLEDQVVLYETATADPGKQVAVLTKGTHVAGIAMLFETLADGSSRTWYHVLTAAGQEGYIISSAIGGFVAGGDTMNSGIVAVSGQRLRLEAKSSSGYLTVYLNKYCSCAVQATETDSDGNDWYRVGLIYETTRYVGYLPVETVMRLYRKEYHGELTSDDSLFSAPSLSGSVMRNIAAGTEVLLTGVVKAADGTVWYGIKEGNGFGYLHSRYVECAETPELDRRYREKITEGVYGLDGKIFKVYGRSDVEKKITRSLPLSGKAGDTFMVNAWGRGTPLPPTDRDPDRHFGIEVVFTDAEGEKDVHHEEFSADILDWQFLSSIVVAKKDYVKVQVSYVYSHQANTAYFEGLALFLEEFGQSYTYDEDNNLISAVDNQKNRQEFEYSDANDMTGVTDAKGNSFTYVYDDKHRVTQGTSAEGVVYRYEYDDATGNVQKSGVVLVEEDLPEPEKGTWVTRTMTSDKNHVASVTDAEGNTVRYGWNLKKDLMTSLTDAKGNKLSYTYDVQKRLTKVSQDVTVDGAVTKVANEYAYADDRLSSILHNGFRYGFAYDGFGNTEAITIAGENVVSYEYGAGNEELVRTVYGNGAGIRYTYDDQDRLKKSYYCDSASGTEAELNTYVYDKQGNLQKVTNHPSGKTYILSYDFLDRLMRVRDEAGNIYEYTYDANNQMTRLKHANPSGASRTDYAYDKDGRETGSTVGGFTRNTFYDQLGRVTDQQWDNDVLTGVMYEYPSSGNCFGTRPNAMRIGDRLISYTYDANGNIVKLEDGSLSQGQIREESYEYDERNQLIRVNSQAQNRTFAYAYDAGGNLTSIREYTYTTGTLGTPLDTVTAEYDSVWKDKLVRWDGAAITYDAIGNMLDNGRGMTFGWTQGRKLSRVTKDGTVSRYVYDHTGMRTKKTVGSTVTEYSYAGRLLLSEKTGNRTNFYHYDSSANLIALTINGTMYFYIRNLQGDVLALVDTTGNTVVEYQYDPWGKPLGITGSKASTAGVQNPFRYRGYYYDNETGFYYVSSRYYDPEIDRFISPDDEEVLGAEHENFAQYNLYSYCWNNPVNMTDETGTWPSWAGAVVGGAVIVGLGIATAMTGGTAAIILGAAFSGSIAGGGIGAGIGLVTGGIDGALIGFGAGAVVGGAIGAAAAGFNIGTGATTIVNKAHGSTLHKMASNIEAGKMVASGKYSQIGLNTSLKKMGLNGGLKRPDVTGIAKRGANKIVEVVSPRQSTAYVRSKMATMKANNPGIVGKVVTWVRNLFR